MADRRNRVLKYFDEQKDYMEGKIQRGIEENRKGWGTVRLTDKDGNPIPGARVELRQMSHDFKFGCSAFLLEELESEENNACYRDKFKNLFNLAVAPFYWSSLEPEQGKPRFAADSPKVYRRPAPDLVLDFCRKNQIEVKAHLLVYHQFVPDWLINETPEIKKALIKRFDEIAARYAKDIDAWDVINETLQKGCYDNQDFVFAREEDYLDWSFQTARKYFKNNRLFINDDHWTAWGSFQGPRSAYYLQIKDLLQRGMPVDGVGMQFHMFYPREQEDTEVTEIFYRPNRLYDIMDCYGSFGKPLHISEITIPAYSEDPEDEAVQEEIVRNLYRIWFSHKDIESIIWWNLVDGYTYVNPKNPSWNENYYYGGLVRHDFTEKPAYRALEHLIHKEWRSNPEVATRENGTAAFHGFYGKYEATVYVGEKKIIQNIHFAKEGSRQFHIVIA